MVMRLLAIAILIICGLVGWQLYSRATVYDRLATAPHNQYIGAENPRVIITEIMDYRCPACRGIHDIMTEFVALHPDVRVVYRVVPIFGEDSVLDAQRAMAAGKQGKFQAMHNKLIRLEKPLTAGEESDLVKELGLDKDQFFADKLSWGTTRDLFTTINAVKMLKIKATPTFVVNKQVIMLPSSANITLEDLEKIFAPYLNTSEEK